jgi:hypothetical protein
MAGRNAKKVAMTAGKKARNNVQGLANIFLILQLDYDTEIKQKT